MRIVISKTGTSECYNYNTLVAMRPWVTPVPIPNTMVKTWTAEGTILETVWESRWPPIKKRITLEQRCVIRTAVLIIDDCSSSQRSVWRKNRTDHGTLKTAY